MVTTDNPFIKAREYMAKHGWCQGRMRNETGQVCLIGAVDFSTGRTYGISGSELRVLTDACRALYPAVPGLDAPRFNDVAAPWFNDAVLQSQDEALDVLDYAAKLWDAEHGG